MAFLSGMQRYFFSSAWLGHVQQACSLLQDRLQHRPPECYSFAQILFYDKLHLKESREEVVLPYSKLRQIVLAGLSMGQGVV